MDLPIFQFKDQICEMVKSNNVCIIQGAAGCGKTTKIPQFLLDDPPRGMRDIKIAVTQPRRVAALAVARRVAFEKGTRIGQEVAYAIRFEDTSTSRTRIKFMTDGVLLLSLIHI